MKKIGDKIKAARENSNNGAGMSQGELADLIGIKQASLSEIELGKTTPRKPTLIALSFVLNDDFGEDWLQRFFKTASGKDMKEFSRKELADLFIKADELSEESFREMKHIWELLKIEIERRQ